MKWISFWQGLLCCVLISFATLIYAVPEAALNEDELVAAHIIKQQQKQAATTEVQKGRVPSSAPPVIQNLKQVQALPDLNAPVIDQAKLLNAAEYQALSDVIRQIYQTQQAQIGIVIVQSTGQQDIFSYALQVAEDWQLGSKKYDNGLLMVIAIADRRIQILTGYGLEGVIPDIVAHQIIQQQITPYFKQEQYAQGIQAGIQEIARILNEDPEVARQAAQSLKQQQAEALQQQRAVQSTFSLSLVVLFLAVIFSQLFGRKMSALGAGIVGTGIGLWHGIGLVMSIITGFTLFFLVISSIAQLLLQALASGQGGGRGGRGGGFGGGGGYRGGGGGFGGGGASGSW